MRLHDWPERLSKTIAAARGTPFAYGRHDCCIFAADCVEALTGIDLAADWRGKYDDEIGGMKLAGVRSLEQLASRYFAAVHPAYAHRGDLALAPVGETAETRQAMMLFVVDGSFLRGPADAVIGRHLAVKAWRVE